MKKKQGKFRRRGIALAHKKVGFAFARSERRNADACFCDFKSSCHTANLNSYGYDEFSMIKNLHEKPYEFVNIKNF